MSKNNQTSVVAALRSALATVREAEEAPNRHPFLPTIRRSLERMLLSSSAPREEREKMVGALGRIVTDDYAFSESAIGKEVLEAANCFAGMDELLPDCKCNDIEQMQGAAAQEYAKHLRQVSIDSANWEVMYECPFTARRWKQFYPNSEAPGDGPPRLTRL